MRQLEEEQLEISRLQQQNGVVQRIQATLNRKQQEINRLQRIVQQYQPSYEQASHLKIQLAEANSNCKAHQRENSVLRREF